MRRRAAALSSEYRILLVDDEPGVIKSLEVLLKHLGYYFKGVTDPLKAIEMVRNERYDMIVLDYIMQPLHGDKVVEKIREFNEDIYILLLTGHKDLAPPLETIKKLAIQGYCEKSDKFDQLILLIESGIKSISQIRTIKRFQIGLNRILQTVPKIYQLQSIDNILEEILKGIMPLVNSEDAFILVDNVITGNKRVIFKGIGVYQTDLEDFFSKLNPVLMEQTGFARVAKQNVLLDNGIILPLIDGTQKSMGVIYVESRDLKEGAKLLEIFASQAASALSNAFLHSLVNIKNEELNRTYDELKIRYIDTIEVLRLTVDAKDVYTSGHSDRVAYLAVKIGEQFDLSQSDLEILKLGGFFHDIGKIGTTDDILLKAGALSSVEYQEIKKHPLKGAHILSAVSMFKEVVPLVRYHHERIDGKGYPDGLKGEQIPFLARILSVADAYDAMTSERQYRSKLDAREAKKQLIKGRGVQFDAEVVDRFLDIVEEIEINQAEIAVTLDFG
ncbi:MAG: DUF3369 domain-containing protein [Firmicutes bacterium]|nr:DUF3369 domain-containing protein [Bacillota bacterium]